ncbi:MAG: peroxiredoxin [Planctomycetes bacterium]|nr:peroxiredoxin [Planctomycetota bacterium]NQU49260.1 peroxiredoxin [Planctomycetota bacterium]
MAVLVTKEAPEFKATAVMADGSFQEISLSDYRGKKVVLYFYPLDFTFVCPSEIIAFDHRMSEFEKRNTVVLGCSIDSHFTHLAWRNTAVNEGGIGPVNYPLIADIDKSIARDYDVLINEAVALRGSFLIDEEGVVRHQVVNDLPLGRNIDEMLRMVDALDFHSKHGEVCPAGWQEGKEGMKASTAGVAEYLASNADKL